MLSLESVTKRYGSTLAVDAVSFQTQPGHIFGLLGPNGAGKSSTIRMITHITVPDSGQIQFLGKPVGRWSQEKMGYLPEERGLYKKMKVGEQLRYLARLKGLSAADAETRLQYWLNRFEATGWKNKKIEELSKGMQQKIQFIATVLHQPELLIFDEPFSGLDPVNAELLQTVILELKAQGKTILFASHRMEQVEQLCDEICLIHQGRVVLNGNVRQIKKQFGSSQVEVEFEGNPEVLGRLGSNGTTLLHHTQNRATFKIQSEVAAQNLLSALLPHLHITRFEIMTPSLNEIFIKTVS